MLDRLVRRMARGNLFWMTDVSRFTKYTSGEPVITVNVAAGLAFGLLVVITEQYLGVQWDELMLTIVGSLFLLAATAIARSKVFSPLSHAAEVEAALMQEPPQPPRA